MGRIRQRPLSFGKSSTKDMLAKAQRDLARLEGAERAQNCEAMGDASLDLAVRLPVEGLAEKTSVRNANFVY